MSTSVFYYAYDFQTEIKLKHDAPEPLREGVTVVHAEAECEGGDYVLLYPYLTVQEVNGIPVGDQSRSLYYGNRCGRSGVPLNLPAGKNHFVILSAVWEDRTACIHFECTGVHPMIRCLVKSVPVSVSVPHDEMKGASLTLRPTAGGVAAIRF